jgi:hypothetical protein
MRSPDPRPLPSARTPRRAQPLAALATVALTAAALLAACASPPPPPPNLPPVTPPLRVEPPPPPPAPPMPLSDYLGKVRAMPGNELLAETQKLLELGDARSRLQAAVALAQPQHPARDEGRAVALAEEVARNGEHGVALREVASLLALWLDETRRAEANQRRAQTKAREDEARLQLTEQRLREMEKRVHDAEKKLEALRAIERELSGRGERDRGNGRQ